jgi:ATP-dependent protease ClpP protease subunit
MDLAELLSRPVMHVTGLIAQEHLDQLSATVQLVLQDPDQTGLTIVLSTPGGDCSYASAMRELIQGLCGTLDIHILALGMCFSAGISVMSAVPADRRYTTPGTRFMLHPARTKVSMKANFDPEWLKRGWKTPLPEIAEFRTSELYDNEQILRSITLDRRRFERLLRTDSYFGARKALKWGFVGHVLEPAAVSSDLTLLELAATSQQATEAAADAA